MATSIVRVRSLLVVSLVALMTLLVHAPVVARSSPRGAEGFQFTAGAYGTYATIGRNVVAGKTAVAGIGGACGTLSPPAHGENTVASVTEDPLFATGVIDTTADAVELPGGVRQATATAAVHDASLLAGLVTASEVTAVSTTSHDGSAFQVSAAGSDFVDLVVAGVPILIEPGPNTQLDLPGFGYVVLNEQVSRTGATSASLTVNMIHVHVTKANILGIPVGTQIIVSHADSGLTSGVHGTLDGQAYGTQVLVAGLIESGPTAKVTLGCLGTNGRVKTNSVAEVILPPFLTVGEVVSTAQGTVTATSAEGETTASIDAVDLVDALLTADLVTAAAQSSKVGGQFSFDDQGSSFANLSVAGHPEIDDNVGPNTRIPIAGLGTLWLHRVIAKANSIEVRMIQLVVTQQNIFGVPIGSDIRVAVASASAH